MVILAILLTCAASRAEAGFIDSLLKRLGLTPRTSLSEDRIIAGFKEALSIGTENTVKLTGRIDGYFANKAIKILLPENIAGIEKPLRLLGAGNYVDSFVLSMNRAAEKAAPYARSIFLGAVNNITFEDVRKLLAGGDTAITDFFRLKTYDALLVTFTPIVDRELANYSVTAKYKAVVRACQKIPFADKLPLLDVNRYVATKALDGLFHVLADEERNIRRNPAARVTELLKEVFK